MGQLEGMVTRYFLVLILALLVTMLSIFSLSLVQTDELQTIKTQEGKKLIISEKINDLDGNPIPLESLTEGKVLLNVWASWCITCLVEHPFLNSITGKVLLRFLDHHFFLIIELMTSNGSLST